MTTYGAEDDAPRYRIKQLTYGFSLGQWVVVDGLTVAFDPVKKHDRTMWTGSEEAAAHYARELNRGSKQKPQPMAASQVRRLKPRRASVVASSPMANFSKCGCGAMVKKGADHVCRTK